MRILCWNTAHGRGSMAALQLADRVAADVVLLQESFPPKKWGSAVTGAVVPGRKWGSWVLVRSGKLSEIDVDGFAGWVAAGTWRRASKSILLASLHSPTASEAVPRRSYIDEARLAVDTIVASSVYAKKHVIGGDFNFKFFGPTNAENAKGSSKKEIATMKHFAGLGFANAWADTHPGATLPQTLRWTKDRTIPYHCDGLLERPFVAADAICEVISSDFIRRHSDHNAVLAVID
jgi:hypothetical protein